MPILDDSKDHERNDRQRDKSALVEKGSDGRNQVTSPRHLKVRLLVPEVL
jgi:hypothetical protein